MCFLAQWQRQTLVVCRCTDGCCDCQVVLCFVHGPKASIFYAHVEKPAMPIVQPGTPFCACSPHQELVLEATEGQGEMVQEEHGVVVARPQVLPQRYELAQITWVFQHLQCMIEEVFI